MYEIQTRFNLGGNLDITIICPVTYASKETKEKLEHYAKRLEANNNTVHLPHRDTNQTLSGYEKCIKNINEIINADEVHIFYDSDSKGVHFDMGALFMLQRLFSDVKIVLAEPVKEKDDFSFGTMLKDWFKNQPRIP